MANRAGAPKRKGGWPSLPATPFDSIPRRRLSGVARLRLRGQTVWIVLRRRKRTTRTFWSASSGTLAWLRSSRPPTDGRIPLPEGRALALGRSVPHGVEPCILLFRRKLTEFLESPGHRLQILELLLFGGCEGSGLLLIVKFSEPVVHTLTHLGYSRGALLWRETGNLRQPILDGPLRSLSWLLRNASRLAIWSKVSPARLAALTRATLKWSVGSKTPFARLRTPARA